MIVTVKRIRREEENTWKELVRDNLLAITVYWLYVYRFNNVIPINSWLRTSNKYRFTS